MNPAYHLTKAAEVALRRGETQRALAFLERASAIDHRSPDLLEMRGLVALSRNDYSGAERSFRKALEGGLMSTRAYCGLGLALLRSGQPQHAHQSFVFATQVAKSANDAWRVRAIHEIRALESGS